MMDAEEPSISLASAFGMESSSPQAEAEPGTDPQDPPDLLPPPGSEGGTQGWPQEQDMPPELQPEGQGNDDDDGEQDDQPPSLLDLDNQGDQKGDLEDQKPPEFADGLLLPKLEDDLPQSVATTSALVEDSVASPDPLTVAPALAHMCCVCEQKFPGMEALQKHIVVHQSTHRFSCRKCVFLCRTKHQLAEHIRKQHVTVKRRQQTADGVDRRLRCVTCGIDSFPSYSYFQTHHLYHHLVTRPAPVVVLEPLASAPPAGLRLTLRRSSTEPAAQFQVVRPSLPDSAGVPATAAASTASSTSGDDWAGFQLQDDDDDLWSGAISSDEEFQLYPKPKRSRKKSAKSDSESPAKRGARGGARGGSARRTSDSESPAKRGARGGARGRARGGGGGRRGRGRGRGAAEAGVPAQPGEAPPAVGADGAPVSTDGAPVSDQPAVTAVTDSVSGELLPVTAPPARGRGQRGRGRGRAQGAQGTRGRGRGGRGRARLPIDPAAPWPGWANPQPGLSQPGGYPATSASASTIGVGPSAEEVGHPPSEAPGGVAASPDTVILSPFSTPPRYSSSPYSTPDYSGASPYHTSPAPGVPPYSPSHSGVPPYSPAASRALSYPPASGVPPYSPSPSGASPYHAPSPLGVPPYSPVPSGAPQYPASVATPPHSSPSPAGAPQYPVSQFSAVPPHSSPIASGPPAYSAAQTAVVPPYSAVQTSGVPPYSAQSVPPYSVPQGPQGGPLGSVPSSFPSNQPGPYYTSAQQQQSSPHQLAYTGARQPPAFSQPVRAQPPNSTSPYFTQGTQPAPGGQTGYRPPAAAAAAASAAFAAAAASAQHPGGGQSLHTPPSTPPRPHAQSPQAGSPMVGVSPALAGAHSSPQTAGVTANGVWPARTDTGGAAAAGSVLRKNSAGAVPAYSPGAPEGGAAQPSPPVMLPHLIPIDVVRPPPAAMVTPVAARPAAVSPEAPRPASFGPKQPPPPLRAPAPGAAANRSPAPGSGVHVVCQHCGVPLPDAAAAQQHAAIYHGRPLPCRLCSFWPTTGAELQRHLEMVHGGGGEGPWQGGVIRAAPPAAQQQQQSPAKRPRMAAPSMPPPAPPPTAVSTALAERGVTLTASGPPPAPPPAPQQAPPGTGRFAVPPPPRVLPCRYCRRQFTTAAARTQHEASHKTAGQQPLPPPPPPQQQQQPRARSPAAGAQRRGSGSGGGVVGTMAGAQLVVPVFDLSVANAARLDALGVRGFLPVSKLGESRGQLGLPVVSVQGITKMGPSPRPVAFFHLGEAFSLRQ